MGVGPDQIAGTDQKYRGKRSGLGLHADTHYIKDVKYWQVEPVLR